MQKIDFNLIDTDEKYDQMIADFFPEILIMKNFYKKSDWHDESGYDHIKQVFFNVKKLLNTYSVDDSELMFYTALFHDYGEHKCMVTNEEGNTSFPNHEIISSVILPAYVEERLGENKFKYLRTLIRLHGDLYLLYIKNKDFFSELFDLYQKAYPEFIYELVFINLSDVMDGHLQNTQNEDYNFMVSTFEKFLKDKI